MLQHIASSKHDTLYVSYSCLAVSTETLDCESIEQSQMKLEKKMAGNIDINSALQELQHVRGGGGIQTYTRLWSLYYLFFS